MFMEKWRSFSLGLAIAGVFGFVTASTLMVSRRVDAATVEPATDAQRGAQAPRPTPGGNLLAQGRQRYDRLCGRCHPGGEEDIGPRLVGINWTEERMVRQIRRGSGRMRAIPESRLPDAEMPALLIYLRSIRSVR